MLEERPEALEEVGASLIDDEENDQSGGVGNGFRRRSDRLPRATGEKETKRK
jgi:hypothetical protein